MKGLIRHRNTGNYIQNLQDEMTKIMEDVFGSADLFDAGSRKLWHPPLEMLETANEYQVKLQLPGFEKKDIDIEVGNDYVTVKAENSFEKEEKKENLYRSEFRYGNFMRTVSFPSNINADKAVAEYKDGILNIKAQKSKRKENVKKIELKE